jgi:hypothetical protein
MRHPAPSGTSEKDLFARNSDGKPVIALTPQSVFAFGMLIRETEQALPRHFSEGLLSGTADTCLGQELCRMSVVRRRPKRGTVDIADGVVRIRTVC